MFGKIGRNTPASTGTNPLRANSLGALIVEDGYQDKTQAGTHYLRTVRFRMSHFIPQRQQSG